MQKQSSQQSIKMQSGWSIPVLGFGTYQMRGQTCWNAVKKALQVGYTHIDTASIYKNQEQIGQLLKEAKIPREKLFITSKIAPNEQGYKQAKKACNQILERLQCDYLDLLLIHWPGVSRFPSDSMDNQRVRRQTWKAMIQLKKQGKLRDIGVSNFLVHHLKDLIQHSKVKPAVNQFEVHPLLWQTQTIQYCRKHNIVIQAYSPLARADQRLLKNKTITGLAQKYNKSAGQICLRWGLQHGFVILPKTKTQSRVQQNIFIFDFTLSAEDMGEIDKLRSANVHTCWDPNSIIH